MYRILSLHHNRIEGTLPSSINQLPSIGCASLLFAVCSSHVGTTKAAVVTSFDFRYLFLNDNLLSGTIPVSMSELTTMSHLFLAGNSFNGTIPHELSNMNALQRLDLSRNSLSGSVPSDLWSGSGSFEYVRVTAGRWVALTAPCCAA